MTVVWHVTMSVDGFIADTSGRLDPLFVSGQPPNPAAQQLLPTIGAFLSGRSNDDLDSPPYGGAWTGPIFVVTHRPPPDPHPGEPYRFVGGDLRAVIAEAVAAAEGKDLVVTGADVAGQCLRAGLVDELQLHVSPVLLGAGIRLYDFDGVDPARLQLLASSAAGDIVNLRYRVG